MKQVSDIQAVILVGGRSLRFGKNKARVVLPNLGLELVSHLVKILSGLNLSPLLITNETDSYADLNVPCLQDEIPNCGPLGGIFTAIKNSPHSHFLVLSCDMPQVSDRLLKKLIGALQSQDEACVFVHNGVRDPFPGIYSRKLFPLITRALHEKRLGMRKLLEGVVAVRNIDVGESQNEFFNMNTKDDYQNLIKDTITAVPTETNDLYRRRLPRF